LTIPTPILLPKYDLSALLYDAEKLFVKRRLPTLAIAVPCFHLSTSHDFSISHSLRFVERKYKKNLIIFKYLILEIMEAPRDIVEGYKNACRKAKKIHE